MKLITANKLNRFWKNGILPKLSEKISKTKVLTTMEQVEANTNEENVAGALVVGELINDLAQQPNFIYDSTGKITGYKTPGGADTVFPFSNLEIEEGTFETYVYGGQTQINTVTFKKSFNNVLGFGACGNSNSNNHLMGVGIISSLTNKKCSFYVHNGGESGYVKIKWVAVGKV